MVTVKLFAFFRENRGKALELDLERHPTPRSICHALQIEPESVGILLVNGFHATFDDKLKDGDLVSLFPPLAGG